MKLGFGFGIVSAVLLIPLLAAAQTAATRISSSVFGADRGRHHQLLQTATGRYAVLGNGLHYTNALGQWQAAHPVVQDLGDFIVCTGATYRVVLNANLNSFGAVDLETSDRQRLVSHPLCIAFFDPESGRREVLAQVKDCPAELVSSNTVVYRDAFAGSGIMASVSYGYQRGRFSQDVTFERAPSVSPADFGMGERTRLEVLTEFVEGPMPAATPRVLKREADEVRRTQMVEPDLVDEQLDYGEMAKFLGRAFSADSAKRDGLPVAKRLLDIGGRTILVEAVEWAAARAKLEALPRQAALTPKANRYAASQRELPKRVAPEVKRPAFETVLANATSFRKPRLASLRSPAIAPRGFVLDYELVETADDLTFESGQTYLVEDEVTLGGVTTFESAAVIKSAMGAHIVLGDVICSTNGSKTVLTASDDASVGEPIGSYTGAVIDYYATEALRFEFPTNDFVLENLDIRHAWTAISVVADNSAPTIYRSRIGHSGAGVSEENAWVAVDTVQLCNVSSWFVEAGETGGISPENVTENCDADLDNDGLWDSWELAWFGNLNQTGAGDYDGDSMTNLQEFQSSSNPANQDSDGDGVIDQMFQVFITRPVLGSSNP